MLIINLSVNYYQASLSTLYLYAYKYATTILAFVVKKKVGSQIRLKFQLLLLSQLITPEVSSMVNSNANTVYGFY